MGLESIEGLIGARNRQDFLVSQVLGAAPDNHPMETKCLEGCWGFAGEVKPVRYRSSGVSALSLR